MDDLLLLLRTYPLLLIAVFGITGACVGSFLNVVIHRLPAILAYRWQTAETSDAPPDGLITPRSRCPHCHTTIKAIHSIPIVSFLLIRGRCRYCEHPVSWRYPLVEFITAIGTIHMGLVFGFTLTTLFGLLLLWTLITLIFIDLDHHLLPDDLTLPLLWMGLLANYFHTFATLEDAVLGAMIGYLSLWLIYHIHRLITGREGMGYGDFKLFAAVGARLGWQFLPLVILLASVVGTLFAVINIGLKHTSKDIPIAFGPYLAVACWVALFWGDALLDTYLRTTNLSTLW